MEVQEQEIKEDGSSSYNNNFDYSPSSSPPTPPSPLPISVGPGLQKYSFSPSPSPPFSPSTSGHESAENLPLLLDTLSTPAAHKLPPSAFSLDGQKVSVDQEVDHDRSASCLKDLINWILIRCCSCLSWSTQVPNQVDIKIHAE